AGTSFGHLTTGEIFPPPGGYKPITGTIYDRLDAAHVSWTDYFAFLPYSGIFQASLSAHQQPIAHFAADAAAGTLPALPFVHTALSATEHLNGSLYETDEHPPADIRAGEYVVSQLITALRNSPSWNDSIIFLTYDEHGGSYDHVKPPAAAQGGARTPDGISPGQCADAASPPASEQVGGGGQCDDSKTDDAPGLCSDFSPTGAFPESCASFEQLGFRVPLVAVSPFSKPNYVSHVVNSHSSFLALIEKRFALQPLTARDTNANDFEDMFDFDNSPSLNAALNVAAPLPQQPGDNGCPFTPSP